MDAEGDWNKDLSAHKLLDQKVLCRQDGDGRSGECGSPEDHNPFEPTSLTAR